VRRIRTILCAVAGLLAVGSLGTWKRFERISRSAAVVRPEAPKQPRTVYKYSIIPGGAYSSQELARSRRLDRVVATHYAGFGSANVSVRPLLRDSYFYVSYRKADRVYWTARKHRIPKGECVLTDGTNLARARCGNRLSLVPQTPVLDIKAPTEAALSLPDAPEGIDFPAPPLFFPEYDAPGLTFPEPQGISGASPAQGTSSAANKEFGPIYFPAGYFFAPFAGLVLPPGGGSTGPGSGGEIPPIVAGGDTPIPEPQGFALLMTGLVALGYLIRRLHPRGAYAFASKPRISHLGNTPAGDPP
jgi:hypothetical protein